MTINADHVRRLVGRLPRYRRWFLQETPLDYNFSVGRTRPRPLGADTFDIPLRPAWSELLIIGEYDYAEGGGANPFLGVRQADGLVWGLDVERGRTPMFILNSSLGAFIETFQVLDGYLAKKRSLPADVKRMLRTIDPDVYGRSDWKKFVEFVLEEQQDP
jgi:hypothetical protein